MIILAQVTDSGSCRCHLWSMVEMGPDGIGPGFGLKHKRNSLVENLGRGVQKRRQAKGLTQESLAELTGLHRTYICDVERGARNVSLSTLALLAYALGTTISKLTAGIDKNCGPKILAAISGRKRKITRRSTFGSGR